MEAMRPQLHESMAAAVKAAVTKDRALSGPYAGVTPWRLR
jgi:hypothetical protein